VVFAINRGKPNGALLALAAIEEISGKAVAIYEGALALSQSSPRLLRSKP
jgi:hypothetical protein